MGANCRSSTDPARYVAVSPRIEAACSGLVPGPSGESPGRSAVDPLDRHVIGTLMALSAETPEFMTELIAEFCEGVERHLVALHSAVEAADGEAVAYVAHTLRGNCGTIGARHMAAVAARLEELAVCGRAEEGSELIGHLQMEYEGARDALAEAMAPGVSDRPGR